MDQEQADYEDSAPPRRPHSLAGTLALVGALTVLFAVLGCAGVLYLLALDAGPK
jgi:hypothetical protein